MESVKMSDVFCCEVDASNFTVNCGVVKEFADDGVLAHELTAKAVNNHDRLVEENAELRETLKGLIECKGILTSDKECVIKAKELLNK